MKISVILCTYNRSAQLQVALQGLVDVAAPKGAEYEVVVVDNNSTDDTQVVLRRWQEQSPFPIVMVREPRQGKSYALNSGIAASTGDVLVFSDDDVEFVPTWLERLVEPFQTAEVVGVGGRIEAKWPGTIPKWWTGNGPYRLSGPIVHFTENPNDARLLTPPWGANMAYRRSVFERFGGFREDLGPKVGDLIRGEDTELGFRVLRAGLRLAYAHGALVYHPVEASRNTKRYFRHWYFDDGRCIARSDGRPAGVYWWGVPRYRVRQLLAALGMVVIKSMSPHRFFWELQLRQKAGLAYEYWRTRAEQPAGQPTIQHN